MSINHSGTSASNSANQQAEWNSLVDVLRFRAAQDPNRTAYRFLHFGEREDQVLSFQQLDAQARRIAQTIRGKASPGDRVLLLYPATLDYVSAFFGCLYAGLIPVPVFPPDPSRFERTLPRLLAIANDAKPRLALTLKEVLPMCQQLLQNSEVLKDCTWFASDDMTADASAWTPSSLQRKDVAFLQYTSGSTSNPKGVMVTHGNILHNEDLIARVFGHDQNLVMASWLPLYHDMGLIGGVLSPLYVGGSCVLFSPMAFLKKPSRWLEAISKFCATTSGGPNFAYDLCVRKTSLKEREQLDLSSWKVAYNGAEPIRADTLTRFNDAFLSAGFRPTTWLPCYGLAESTLLVSGCAHDARPTMVPVSQEALRCDQIEAPKADADQVQLVSVGKPEADIKIAIVDPQTLAPCPAEKVGEIWVKSPSVAQGYWNNPEATSQSFHGRMSTGDAGYLRTGDLGFLRNGELFITGRRKDLLIVRGQNLYPQDLEATAESSHPLLRPSSSAAFTIDAEGEEQVVFVAEVQRSAENPAWDEVIEKVSGALFEQHQVMLYELVLVQAGSIHKTSSGKIQRQATRKAYLAEELDVVARQKLNIRPQATEYVAPRDSIETELVRIWEEVMQRDRIGIRDDFFDLGGHSVIGLQMLARVREILCVDLPISELLTKGRTIENLAEIVTDRLLDDMDEDEIRRLEQEIAEESMDLIHESDKPETPIER